MVRSCVGGIVATREVLLLPEVLEELHVVFDREYTTGVRRVGQLKEVIVVSPPDKEKPQRWGCRDDSHVMHGLLFNIRQDVIRPSAWLSLARAVIRIAGPGVRPASGRKIGVGRFVLPRSDGQLLKIVGTLGSPARLAALCTAGKSSPIKMPMMVMTTKSSTKVKARRLIVFLPLALRALSARNLRE